MDKKQLPIGFFDSGVGGLSVLREAISIMPNENYIFFGDSKNDEETMQALPFSCKVTHRI